MLCRPPSLLLWNWFFELVKWISADKTSKIRRSKITEVVSWEGAAREWHRSGWRETESKVWKKPSVNPSWLPCAASYKRPKPFLRAGPEILQARPEKPSKIAKSLLLPTLLPFLWSLTMRTYSNPSADHGGTQCILLLSTDSNALLVKFSLRATAAFPNTKQMHWVNHSNQTGWGWCYPGSSVPAVPSKLQNKELWLLLAWPAARAKLCAVFPPSWLVGLAQLILPFLLQPLLSPQWMVLLPLHSSPHTNWNIHSAPAD